MILLDTHVLLWALARSSRIGRGARARLGSGDLVHASAVSMAEIMIKSALGKLRAPDDLARSITDAGLIELPLTARQVAAMSAFPELARHDPFDRMLVAQAASDGLTFVTADTRLLGLGLDFLVDATQ
ncbi:MAG: PIN domain-containing protein [Jatrophihabitans sp.]|nr:MAG: PIN domain-containing protein [Jatrophihabitans sp.]